jgi:hypothetical protein
LLVAQGFNEVVLGQLQVTLQNINGGGRSASMIFGTQAVPEPTSLLLMTITLVGLASTRRLSHHTLDVAGPRRPRNA